MQDIYSIEEKTKKIEHYWEFLAENMVNRGSISQDKLVQIRMQNKTDLARAAAFAKYIQTGRSSGFENLLSWRPNQKCITKIGKLISSDVTEFAEMVMIDLPSSKNDVDNACSILTVLDHKNALSILSSTWDVINEIINKNLNKNKTPTTANWEETAKSLQVQLNLAQQNAQQYKIEVENLRAQLQARKTTDANPPQKSPVEQQNLQDQITSLHNKVDSIMLRLNYQAPLAPQSLESASAPPPANVPEKAPVKTAPRQAPGWGLSDDSSEDHSPRKPAVGYIGKAAPPQYADEGDESPRMPPKGCLSKEAPPQYADDVDESPSFRRR